MKINGKKNMERFKLECGQAWPIPPVGEPNKPTSNDIDVEKTSV